MKDEIFLYPLLGFSIGGVLTFYYSQKYGVGAYGVGIMFIFAILGFIYALLEEEDKDG